MFWSDADLAELEGTSVVGLFCFSSSTLFRELIFFTIEKLGREEAENDYREKILPAVSVGRCCEIADNITLLTT